MANKFSPSDAAISVFSFAKSNKEFTLKYMGIMAVMALVSMASFISTGYLEFANKMMEFQKSGATPSESDAFAAISLIKAPQLILFIIIATAFSIAILTMALRKTVRNEEIGFYGLSWGKDENAICIAMLKLFGIVFLGSFVIGFASGLLGIAGISSPIIMLTGIALFMIFILGRYGFYGVYTIVKGKSALKETTEATKDQFWSVVGAFLLCWAIMSIGALVLQSLFGLILRPLMGDVGANGLPKSLSGFFSIGGILYFLVIGAIGGFANLAYVCVGAFAYHKMNEATQIEEHI